VLDRFRLDGRVAVVTGAGRGIGAATAVALAEAGADVVIAARSPDQLGAIAAAIEAAGRAAHVVVADLSDTAQAARLSGAAREAFGRLDVVVNNVGGAVPRPFLDTTAEALEEAVNAIAAGTIATAATEVITADAGLRSRVEAATPLRRLGTVDDVAAAVLYLASPASAYLTGTVLEVHGGLQAPNTQQPLPDL